MVIVLNQKPLKCYESVTMPRFSCGSSHYWAVLKNRYFRPWSNSFNPIQLSAWRANVDMQFIVSRRRVIDYCTKYITKSEPRFESLKDTFNKIVRSLKDGNRSLKAVQKLLIHTVGDRPYSAQETCHILLQLYQCTRHLVISLCSA